MTLSRDGGFYLWSWISRVYEYAFPIVRRSFVGSAAVVLMGTRFLSLLAGSCSDAPGPLEPVASQALAKEKPPATEPASRHSGAHAARIFSHRVGTDAPRVYGVDGENVISVIAIDAAGNRSAAATFNIFIPF